MCRYSLGFHREGVLKDSGVVDEFFGYFSGYFFGNFREKVSIVCTLKTDHQESRAAARKPHDAQLSCLRCDVILA